MLSRLLPLAASILFLTACDSGTDPVSSLDDQLGDALAEAGGAESFRMPDETDLAAIPQDPLNPLSASKVELGQLLFHETALGKNAQRAEGMSTFSCATCHHASAGFRAGVPQGIGDGGTGFGRFGEGRSRDLDYAANEIDIQPFRSPSALNGAWQDVTLWNGQFGATGTNAGTESEWTVGTPIATNELGYEGLETQAIAGLAVHRMTDGPANVYSAYPRYRELFDEAFADRAPEERATPETAGLAIAAYERTLLATRAPFQKWLRGERSAMTQAQKRGAVVFFGKAQCTACHTGPALASNSFHALGMGELVGPGVFSDFNPKDPAHLGRASFTQRPEDRYRFKTPQLYNATDDPHLGHGSTFRSVREVVEYKNAAVPQSRFILPSELSPSFVPLNLTPDDLDDLVSFLERALYDPELDRYTPTSVPSGNCFPNNDPQSRRDLGCTGSSARPLTVLGRGQLAQ